MFGKYEIRRKSLDEKPEGKMLTGKPRRRRYKGTILKQILRDALLNGFN
jgi:hypothetical protein